MYGRRLIKSTIMTIPRHAQSSDNPPSRTAQTISTSIVELYRCTMWVVPCYTVAWEHQDGRGGEKEELSPRGGKNVAGRDVEEFRAHIKHQDSLRH